MYTLGIWLKNCDCTSRDLFREDSWVISLNIISNEPADLTNTMHPPPPTYKVGFILFFHGYLVPPIFSSNISGFCKRYRELNHKKRVLVYFHQNVILNGFPFFDTHLSYTIRKVSSGSIICLIMLNQTVKSNYFFNI